MIIHRAKPQLSDATTLIVALLLLVGISLAACGAPSPSPGRPLTGQPPQATAAKPTEVSPTSANNAVAILVIDDFKSLPNESQPGKSDECLVTPDGLYYSARGGSLAPYGGKPHGELVYEELRHLLMPVGQSVAATSGTQFFNNKALNLDWIRLVERWDSKQYGTIFLVEIDTNQYQTDIIRLRIDQTISLFENSKEPDKEVVKFVLNMSFGIVPCDPTFGKNDKDVETLVREYLDLISKDEGLTELRAQLTSFLDKSNTVPPTQLLKDPSYNQSYNLVSLTLPYFNLAKKMSPDANPKPEDFNPWVNEGVMPYREGAIVVDPIFSEIQALSANDKIQVISIASAGNSGLKFPFAPALWDGVLGVSAFDAQPDTNVNDFVVSPPVSNKASYSNSGEVMLNGMYFDMTIKDENGDPVRGTSFAAPEMSLLAAIHLLKGGAVHCQGPSGATTPPMNYAPAYELWHDKPLGNAITDFCADFRVP